jgi:hypothetical protein
MTQTLKPTFVRYGGHRYRVNWRACGEAHFVEEQQPGGYSIVWQQPRRMTLLVAAIIANAVDQR